jgi:hypothetical protein
MRGQLSEALKIINCLRALARVLMIQRNEADVPEMLTGPGKWLDADTVLSKGTSETRHLNSRVKWGKRLYWGSKTVGLGLDHRIQALLANDRVGAEEKGTQSKR